MRPEVIRLADLSSEDRAGWRELARHAIEPNPFFEPDYLEPLARGLGQEGDVLLVVVRQQGAWTGCAPVVRSDRWHRVPLPATATWRGHVLFGLLGTPLVRDGAREEALPALLAGMASARPRSSYLALEWIGDDGPIADGVREWAGALGSRQAAIRFEDFERAVLRRRPEDTYLKDAISSKHRAELRRHKRRLGEALGGDPVLVDRAGDDRAPSDFIALEVEGHKSSDRTTLSENPGYTDFFREMCAGFAAQGRLQLLALEGGGQTVAMTCNITAGDIVFGLKTAFAPQWSEFSPGLLLEAEQFSHFHDNLTARMLDTCADPNNTVINRFFPDRRPIATLVLPAEGVLGLLSRPALQVVRAVRERRS